MPRIPRTLPAIPRIRKTTFPDQMFMNRRNGQIVRSNLDPEVWDLPYIPVQGPELPWKLEQRRQYLRDAQDAYDADLAEELARQMGNRKRMAQAVEMRKRELWREYMDAEDPAPGIGWPTGKAERLDDEFESQANWDVRGMKNPNEYPDPPDWDFRERYKDAPWRMW